MKPECVKHNNCNYNIHKKKRMVSKGQNLILCRSMFLILPYLVEYLVTPQIILVLDVFCATDRLSTKET